MEIKRSGSQPSGKGPGRMVHRHGAHRPAVPAASAGARRRRMRSRSSPAPARPGTRHPLGQTLIVTAGCGRVQRWGGPIEEIRPGDVVWFAPGEKHWHGASPTTAMTHIAIQEALDGKSRRLDGACQRRAVRAADHER